MVLNWDKLSKNCQSDTIIKAAEYVVAEYVPPEGTTCTLTFEIYEPAFPANNIYIEEAKFLEVIEAVSGTKYVGFPEVGLGYILV